MAGVGFWDRLDRGNACACGVLAASPTTWCRGRPASDNVGPARGGIALRGAPQLRVSVGPIPRSARTTGSRVHSKADVTTGVVAVGTERMDALFDAWLVQLRRTGRSPNYITGAGVVPRRRARRPRGTRPCRRPARLGDDPTVLGAALQCVHLRLETRHRAHAPRPQGRRRDGSPRCMPSISATPSPPSPAATGRIGRCCSRCMPITLSRRTERSARQSPLSYANRSYEIQRRSGTWEVRGCIANSWPGPGLTRFRALFRGFEIM